MIELIFVMVLLAIGSAMVAPSMASFYRGRMLSSEAKRVLALVHYGQSRAIAEGVPVLLWINAKDSTYGLRVTSAELEGGGHATSFTADATVTLDTPLHGYAGPFGTGRRTAGPHGRTAGHSFYARRFLR